DDAADRLRDHAAHPLRPGREEPDEERARSLAAGETAAADGEQAAEAPGAARPPRGPPRGPRRLHPVPQARRDHDVRGDRGPRGSDRHDRLLRPAERLRDRELVHREEQLDEDQQGGEGGARPDHAGRDDPPDLVRSRARGMERRCAPRRRPEGMTMTDKNSPIEKLAGQEYQYGFVTAIEEEKIPKGLNEEIVRLISSKKNA